MKHRGFEIRCNKESVLADSCASGGRLRHLPYTPECASRGAFLTYRNEVSYKLRKQEKPSKERSSVHP